MRDFKPSSFTTKKGKHVQTRPHFATFNKVHNASRTRCYLVLYHRRYKLGLVDGLTLGELCRASGVDYNYVKTKIARWCEWGFCERKPVVKNGRPVFSYTIGERGQHFIEDIVPREWLEWYIAEIQAFKANTGPAKGVEKGMVKAEAKK